MPAEERACTLRGGLDEEEDGGDTAEAAVAAATAAPIVSLTSTSCSDGVALRFGSSGMLLRSRPVLPRSMNSQQASYTSLVILVVLLSSIGMYRY